MGLFDKKYCDICGKEIKLLGNRKLDDGNMCKDCASKLSPWFTGRRHTSVAAIKQQLQYREANEAALKNFAPTEIVGKRYKVYFDDNLKKFLVSASSNFRNANPDMISYSDVLGVKITVDEDVDEQFDEDKEGKKVSFDPPKYEYEYKFNVCIQVRNDFFDDLNFELTEKRPISPESDLYREYVEMANQICTKLTNRGFEDPRKEFAYYKNGGELTEEEETKKEEVEVWYCMKCGTKNEGGKFCRSCGAPKPVAEVNRFCPECGTKITDADTKFCPSCGHKL
ncbi:MAG: DUF4428 domain-containing protein [Erysipelotrichaceae bacterium]|nr:DUF4428 domain-containing protein [Erysipelotrichaceae bacterium]MBR5049285.1 DUF4428 domain-containing protein [Erysipelotrichaceae bacterium]